MLGLLCFLYHRKMEAGTLMSSFLLLVFLMSISEALGKSWQMTLDTSSVQVPENSKLSLQLMLKAFMYLLTINHFSFSDTLVAAAFSRTMPEVKTTTTKTSCMFPLLRWPCVLSKFSF